MLYQFESNKIQPDIEVTVAVSKGIEIVGKAPHKSMSIYMNADEEESVE